MEKCIPFVWVAEADCENVTEGRKIMDAVPVGVLLTVAVGLWPIVGVGVWPIARLGL
jgi:hypothetical protein